MSHNLTRTTYVCQRFGKKASQVLPTNRLEKFKHLWFLSRESLSFNHIRQARDPSAFGMYRLQIKNVFCVPMKTCRQMTMCKLKNPIFSVLLMSLFFTSCNGQASKNQSTSNTISTDTTEQHPRIVRTMGTKSEVVHCELLDKDGNLWFGTKWFGLSRFDGKTFTTFSQYDN